MSEGITADQLAPGVRTVYSSVTDPPITNAQIKTLPTTPITIVPPLGSGLVALVQDIVFVGDTWTNFYTNLDENALLQVRYIGGDTILTIYEGTPATFNLSGLLGSDVKLAQAFPDQKAFDNSDAAKRHVFDVADVENVGIELFLDNGGSGNLTGGDEANFLTVDVSYRIIEAVNNH